MPKLSVRFLQNLSEIWHMATEEGVRFSVVIEITLLYGLDWIRVIVTFRLS